MLETISQLLAQLTIFYLLTKTIIPSFDFPILNICILVNDTTRAPSPLPPSTPTKKVTSLSYDLDTRPTVLLSYTQAQSQHKSHIIISNKQRTPKTKKPRCNITPKINEMGPPGLQCATM